MGQAKRGWLRIVVLGDINVDVFEQIPAWPSPGEECIASALELHCGGVGANTAIALARWGVGVRLLGRTGRDCFGEIAFETLRDAGIDVAGVEQTGAAMTGLMFIAVSPDGQRTIFGTRGANGELGMLPRDGRHLEGAAGVHLVGYNFLTSSVACAAEQLIEGARQTALHVSLDVGMAPSRQIPHKILQVVPKIDILFVSLEEALPLVGEAEPHAALEALRARGAAEVVMKLGEKGCLFSQDGEVREAPSFPVAAVDTTGAGDAFAAAYLRARLAAWPQAEAALVANAAGAATAGVVGAGEGMPDPAQVASLVRRQRVEAAWEPARRRVLERIREEFEMADASQG